METLEIEINESEHLTQTRISIHIVALLSQGYIQNKTFRL